MLDKITAIAKEAGEIIRQGYRKDFGMEYKGASNNIVTEIDKKSEKCILDFLKKEFPTHSYLAEESGRAERDSDYIWIIDPLDGTTNFAHGLPIFSVSIGVQKNGETIYGVVYDVMRDYMYAAEKGSGATNNGRKISVSSKHTVEESLLVTGFPYDIKTNPGNSIELFTAFLQKARAVRRLGSAAIDLCYVADGIFEGFWEPKLSPWDITAGKLLVEEAGGKVTDYKGNPMPVTSKEILATNGLVHDEMVEVLK